MSAAKNTPARKSAKGATIEHSAAIAAYAASRKITPDLAGKQFRAKLRSNADTVTLATGKPHEKGAPWGAHKRSQLAKLFPNVPAFR